jgi:hypothetical protein
MTKDKAQLYMSFIVDTLEGVADWTSQDASTKTKATYVGTIGGIAMSTLLEHKGWWSFLRVVFGAILIRYKHPGLVNLKN